MAVGRARYLGQPEVVRDCPGLLDHDPVRHEPRIHIAGNARGVVGKGHSGTTNNENVRYDAPAGQAVAQSGEGPFKIGPAQKDIVGFAHAASKSLADR
jgi:hypothetical protein